MHRALLSLSRTADCCGREKLVNLLGCKVVAKYATLLNYFCLSSSSKLSFSRRLQAIERERSPQVLAILHNDEDHSEDEEFGGVESDITDDEEGKREDTEDTSPPDSSPGGFTLQTHYCSFQ